MNSDRLVRAIRLILDSGLMYTVCVVIFFATSLGGSNAQYPISDVVVQMIVRTALIQSDMTDTDICWFACSY